MARIVILWNQTEPDVTTLWREDGRKTTEWDPTKVVDTGDTVQEEMDLLEAAVRSGGHDVEVVNIKDSLEVVYEAVRKRRPDAVVNLVEWFKDDLAHEHHVAALFELMGIPYTGARPLGLALCQNKPHAKALFAAAGVPTPRWMLIDPPGKVGRFPGMRRYPMIVKPAYEDASGGIDAGSIVYDRKALEARVKKVVEEYRMPALVEEYIDGREIHCAVLGNPPVALPLFEMEFKEMVGEDGKPLPRIITHRAKWDPFSRDYYAVESKCPAEELEPEVVEKIKAAAIKACRAVGTRDYARVDMRVDAETGDPYVLEVNPNPDLAPNCAFAQCVRASGRTYDQAVVEIVEAALERGKGAVKPPAAQDVLLNEYVAKKRGVVK